MPGPYIKQYTEYGTKSKKTGKTPEYIVSLKENGEWECSCPSWCTIVPRQNCKHILRRIFKLMEDEKSLPGVPVIKSTTTIKKVQHSEGITRTISFEDV